LLADGVDIRIIQLMPGHASGTDQSAFHCRQGRLFNVGHAR
jgi:hypothetical protein